MAAALKIFATNSRRAMRKVIGWIFQPDFGGAAIQDIVAWITLWILLVGAFLGGLRWLLNDAERDMPEDSAEVRYYAMSSSVVADKLPESLQDVTVVNADSERINLVRPSNEFLSACPSEDCAAVAQGRARLKSFARTLYLGLATDQDGVWRLGFRRTIVEPKLQSNFNISESEDASAQSPDAGNIETVEVVASQNVFIPLSYMSTYSAIPSDGSRSTRWVLGPEYLRVVELEFCADGLPPNCEQVTLRPPADVISYAGEVEADVGG